MLKRSLFLGVFLVALLFSATAQTQEELAGWHYGLANEAYKKGDIGNASIHVGEALSLYTQLGDVSGQIRCNGLIQDLHAGDGIEGLRLLGDIGLIILVSTLFAFFTRLLRQPMILAYVAAGIVIGPFGLKLITEQGTIETLAELGIAFLLFMVGLELDINRLKDVGKVSAGCGLGQILITFIIGFVLAALLNQFTLIESFYIAFALTISSTMIVVKLLSDKEELDTLHGKIVLGTLLIQDVVTIMVLAVLTTLNSFTLTSLVTAAFTGIGLVALAIIMGRYVLPPLFCFAARSVEHLFLTSLAWCFVFSAFSYIVFTNLLGFGGSAISIGSFLAGVSLASFPYNIEIVGRIRSLKDFFVVIFFVSLGMQVPLYIPLIQNVILFSLFVLIGTPIIMMFICSLFGYGKRTSLLTGLALAQISEFSLILAGEGFSFGHIRADMLSLVTWIMLVTSTVSSYYILHGGQIYNRLLPALKVFNRFSMNKILEDVQRDARHHVIVFGCDRMGGIIIKTLQAMKKDFVVVDINPEIIKSLMSQRIPSLYGDIDDMEVLERVNLKDANVVISTIPNLRENLLIIEETKKRNPDAVIIITARNIDNALTLYKADADYVILPHILSGERVSEFLTDYIVNKDEFAHLKRKHMERLENQKRLDILMKYEPSFIGMLERKFEHMGHRL
ncbi:MAG: cation:proton antiporter [Candidatus Altiarchaeota archaeon]|nr:cation:proton antiporter [Candidatus Altiarchaeota archaeon]